MAYKYSSDDLKGRKGRGSRCMKSPARSGVDGSGVDTSAGVGDSGVDGSVATGVSATLRSIFRSSNASSGGDMANISGVSHVRAQNPWNSLLQFCKSSPLYENTTRQQGPHTVITSEFGSARRLTWPRQTGTEQRATTPHRPTIPTDRSALTRRQPGSRRLSHAPRVLNQNIRRRRAIDAGNSARARNHLS